MSRVVHSLFDPEGFRPEPLCSMVSNPDRALWRLGRLWTRCSLITRREFPILTRDDVLLQAWIIPLRRSAPHPIGKRPSQFPKRTRQCRHPRHISTGGARAFLSSSMPTWPLTACGRCGRVAFLFTPGPCARNPQMLPARPFATEGRSFSACLQAMKEPARSQAKLRETVYFRASPWKDGKPEKTGAHAVALLVVGVAASIRAWCV